MTELWISFLVTIVWALFATTSRMGQIAIVSRAIRMTGAREVIDLAALGLASSHVLSGARNLPIVSKDVRVQKNETGKICRQPRHLGVTYPCECECPDGKKSDPASDQL